MFDAFMVTLMLVLLVAILIPGIFGERWKHLINETYFVIPIAIFELFLMDFTFGWFFFTR